jgi:hypothetical protein
MKKALTISLSVVLVACCLSIIAVAVKAQSLQISVSPEDANASAYQKITFYSTVSGGTSPYQYRWAIGTSPLGALSILDGQPWNGGPNHVFVEGSGTYFVVAEVKDANNNTATWYYSIATWT